MGFPEARELMLVILRRSWGTSALRMNLHVQGVKLRIQNYNWLTHDGRV